MEKYGANKWVKSFKSWDHLVAMMFAQISAQTSLRDVVATFNAHPTRHYHMDAGKLSRSTLSDANAQRPVAVFEALWAVRTLLELTAGVVVDVMAFKIHGPEDIEEITELDFDIRDHLTIHAMEIGEKDKSYWVHTHGMAKFGQLDVEMFNITEEDLAAAETFFHELCTDLAFGQGPQQRAIIRSRPPWN